jgi:hypothetical protein
MKTYSRRYFLRILWGNSFICVTLPIGSENFMLVEDR